MAGMRIKRAYHPASRSDGRRILVDGLWPRGMSKDRLRIDDWARELAPSAELRAWFGHDARKWDEFCKRYARELDAKPEEVEALRNRLRDGPVTLIYGAKDEDHNNALALKAYLERWERRA